MFCLNLARFESVALSKCLKPGVTLKFPCLRLALECSFRGHKWWYWLATQYRWLWCRCEAPLRLRYDYESSRVWLRLARERFHCLSWLGRRRPAQKWCCSRVVSLLDYAPQDRHERDHSIRPISRADMLWLGWRKRFIRQSKLVLDCHANIAYVALHVHHRRAVTAFPAWLTT